MEVRNPPVARPVCGWLRRPRHLRLGSRVVDGGPERGVAHPLELALTHADLGAELRHDAGPRPLAPL